MMTVAGTVIPLTDICHNTTIITKTDIREMLTKKVTLEKGPILPSVMEKITGIGITTNRTADTTVIVNIESWMTTGVEITGQAWKEI